MSKEIPGGLCGLPGIVLYALFSSLGALRLMMILGLSGSVCVPFGDAVKQADGEALLIQRAGVTVIVNNGYNWRLRQRFVVLPIFVVHIGHAIPPYNIAVLGLGGAHCINGLLFGQTIERQPRPSPNAPTMRQGAKIRVHSQNTSILNI